MCWRHRARVGHEYKLACRRNDNGETPEPISYCSIVGIQLDFHLPVYYNFHWCLCHFLQKESVRYRARTVCLSRPLMVEHRSDGSMRSALQSCRGIQWLRLQAGQRDDGTIIIVDRCLLSELKQEAQAPKV